MALTYSVVVNDTFNRTATPFPQNQSAGTNGTVPGAPTMGLTNNWIDTTGQNLGRWSIVPAITSGGANYLKGGGNSAFTAGSSLGISAAALYRGSPEWMRDTCVEAWQTNTNFVQAGVCARAQGKVSNNIWFAGYYDGTNINFGYVIFGQFVSLATAALASSGLTFANGTVHLLTVYETAFATFSYTYSLFYASGGTNQYSGNPASPGTPLQTVTGTYAYTTPAPNIFPLGSAGGFGILVSNGAATFNLFKGYAVTNGLTATTAAQLVPNQTGQVISLTNTGATAWTPGSSTTFAVGNTNGLTTTDLTRSGASVVSQTVLTSTTAQIVVNTGTCPSTLNITDTVNNVSTAVYVHPTKVYTIAAVGDSRQAYTYGVNPSASPQTATTIAAQSTATQRNEATARHAEVITAVMLGGGGYEFRPNGSAIGGTIPRLYWPASKSIVSATVSGGPYTAGNQVVISFTGLADGVNGPLNGYTGMRVTIGSGTANAETLSITASTASSITVNPSNPHANGETITAASPVYQLLTLLNPDFMFVSTGINSYQSTPAVFQSDWNIMMWNDTAHGGSGANDGLYYMFPNTKFIVPQIDVNNYAGSRAQAVSNFLNPYLAAVCDNVRIFNGQPIVATATGGAAGMYNYNARKESHFYIDGLHQAAFGMEENGLIEAIMLYNSVLAPAVPVNPTPTGLITFVGH